MTGAVLITGCSSGYGEAAAKLFALRGWNVIATMRNPDHGRKLTDLKNILVVRLDVQDRDSIDKAITQAIRHFGRIDAVVNNAGYGLFSPFEPSSRDAIQKQFDVNVFGAMDVIRSILPHFRTNRSGTIINISSGAGVFGAPMASIYCASKFALEGFSESLAYELADLGIAVKLIEPGGAPGTGFMTRSKAETGGLPIPDDYNVFMAHAAQIYGAIATNSDSDAIKRVAEAIFAAATDGTDQLRYMPNDDIRALLTARRESSEQEFIALMRGFFLPRPSSNA
ncbi:SDR family oxidoreductase [Bradyrhizobium sp. JYMT SZCCT0428]|uniref:SDR family oxidoreductase n=1 Tax=Bradyrhizobium sp. JYMT SZCCT0428 TaxID=2807673 RepID=UPI001BA667B2|nr:SDR family oxidoreductase [Bradyrhizobium sp. JYMT SZCCT0428]MBR1155963.1 SDR family oxidoreductase [Bradyrhizobium sp. JYMT SZCCT0428]